ncbi:DMT family transporter [Actinomycetospora sp. CA-084318]|uniref:DMT family transporter n=1 Tax=Actinomycetospora sp. CA-084318 TaxID=3239892 RepID=UPI003D97E47F
MRPGTLVGTVLLGASIVCEVAGTMLLHASQGFSSPVASLGVLAGYGISILLFSRALQYGLTLGIAYGTLTGCGLVAATVASTVVFGDPIAPLQIAGLALILLGALTLQTTPRAAGGTAE